VFSRPTYKDLHAAGLPGTVCYCSCSGQPVLEGGGAVILSRASSLMYAGNSAATWSKNITKRNAPFLTCVECFKVIHEVSHAMGDTPR